MSAKKSSQKIMPKSISFNMRKSSDLVIRIYPSDTSTVSSWKTCDSSIVCATESNLQDTRIAGAIALSRYDKVGRHERHGQAIPVLELEVHSHILTEQSEYFERQLSGRWLNNGTVDDCLANQSVARSRSSFDLSCLNNIDYTTYERCFKLMYQAHYERSTTLLQARFRDVVEGLQVLQLSVFFLFSSGVNAALFFLQAVPWTPDEKDSVIHLLLSLDLSSLDVALLNDLWARVNGLDDLFPCNNPHIRALVLEEWEKVFVDWKQRLQNTCFLQRSHSLPSGSQLPSPDETRAFCNRSIWLFEKAIDLRVGHKAIQFMATDRIDLSAFLVTNLFQRWPGTSQSLQLRASSVVLSFYIVLLRLLEALERGEVICDCDTRCGLLCKWFPVIAHTFDKRVSCSSEDRNHFGKPTVCQVQMYINSYRLFPESAKARHLDNLVNCEVDPKQAITEALEAVIRSLRPLDQQKILSLWIQSDILLNNRSAPILDLEGSFKQFCESINQCPASALPSLQQRTSSEDWAHCN